MKNIEENDTFLLWRHYTLSNTDRKVLAMLYLPLIGFESFGMYSYFDSLLGEKEYYQGPLNNLKKNLNIDGFHFILAREKLEAIGLLKLIKKISMIRMNMFLICNNQKILNNSFLMSF